MTMNQMMVLCTFMMGDQSARNDAQTEHNKLKLVDNEWVLSPIGSYLEEEFRNPGSQVASLLKDKALAHLSKIVRV